MTTHIMPYAESVSFSRNLAGQLAMFVIVVSLVGRLVFGWVGDRLNRIIVVVVTMVIQTVSMLVLIVVGSGFLIIPFLLFYGLWYGGFMPNRAAISHDYFGANRFGSLLGVLMGLSVAISMVGPVITGWLFDITGSYQIAFLICTVVLVLGTLPLMVIKRPTIFKPY